MKTILRLEELALLCLSIYGFSLLGFSWWWFVLLLLTPDIGMLGYLVNSKVGAITYNIFHTRLLAIIILGIGIYIQSDVAKLIGIILFAHAAMDRFLGYGLKYSDSFWHTHLGMIKK